MINILTLKVDTKYSAEYVNRLYNSIKRNTTVKFKFYCYTENPVDLLPEICIIPIEHPNKFKLQWHKLIFHKTGFADIPMGRFRAYYRTSANERYTVQPGDMQNIQFNIGYIDKNGSGQTLTVGASLQQTLYNSAQSESSASIREKAPQVYYSQDRMITAEDYNIVPLKASQEIIKIRSVNRTASGISRAKEILDPTGAYSNVNVFADDGLIYREE